MELAKENRKSKVHHIHSEEDFEEQVKNAGDKLVVVDFYATWCGPCNNISPHLDNFADTYESQVLILKINVDEQGELATRFKVFSMPTFIFFKNGQILGQYSDASPVRMEDTIKKLIN